MFNDVFKYCFYIGLIVVVVTHFRFPIKIKKARNSAILSGTVLLPPLDVQQGKKKVFE